jgi:hypothetical protein
MNNTPTTWKQLVTMITNKDFGKLKREAGIQNKYQQFMRHTSEADLSHIIFNTPLSNEQFDMNQEWLSNRVSVFRPNDFPYHVEPGIFHDVLWSNHPLDSDTVQELVNVKMNQLCRTKFIYFENPDQLKTVPGLFHVHVFSRAD